MSPKGLYTPPSSDIEPDTLLPPSPPASPKRPVLSPVSRLLGVLRLCKAGRLPGRSDYRIYNLSSIQFADFQERLEADEQLWSWYQAKAHWDYDPREERYVLRMPTRTHERFIVQVNEAVTAAITALSQDESLDGEIRNALKGVYQAGSTTLELHAPKLENSSQSSQGTNQEVVVHRSPDASFYHEEEDALPALVVEVSNSQQRKDLPRLAESYIVDSRHAIRCVLGLDITYAGKGKRKDKTASVSLWRPGVEVDEEGEEVGMSVCHVDAVSFRDSEGEACEGELEIKLEGLVPASVWEKLPEPAAEQSITISYAQLATFLAHAEREVAESKIKTNTSAPKKFRKRKRSPSEELSDGREAAYLKQEEAELAKERAVDCEWKGSGWHEARDEEQAAGGVEAVERRRSKRNKSGRAVSEGS